MFFQIIFWNQKHVTNPMNSSKEEIVLSRDNRELFVQRLVKIFFSKSKAQGGEKSKNRHPSWLYSAVAELSEAAIWNTCVVVYF